MKSFCSLVMDWASRYHASSVIPRNSNILRATRTFSRPWSLLTLEGRPRHKYPKNALKIYPEIPIFSLKIPPKISNYPKNFLKIPKYPQVFSSDTGPYVIFNRNWTHWCFTWLLRHVWNLLPLEWWDAVEIGNTAAQLDCSLAVTN